MSDSLQSLEIRENLGWGLTRTLAGPSDVSVTQ